MIVKKRQILKRKNKGYEKIRKEIVSAVGLGTRFLHKTKAQPKEMILVFDKLTV